MGSGPEFTVLELDGPRLSAVSAQVGAGTVRVKRRLSASKPDGIGDSSEAVGRWVGEELRRAGMARNRVVIAVSRDDVILKQVALPAAAGATEADLAGIVRLQLSRQLTMAMEGTAVDYTPMTHRAGADGLRGGEGSVSVLAGAMPAERRQWWRSMAEAGGMKVSRIGLRSFGAAALMGDLSLRRAGPILGVAVGANSVEFVVVEDGRLVFSRTSDAAGAGMRADWTAFTERVAVEAKRTWMSCRVSRGGPDVELVAVLGEGALAGSLAEKCGDAVGVPGVTVTTPSLVEIPAEMAESERGEAAPLLGLLVESVTDRPTLDFANPRKAPDTTARSRQLVLACVLGAIVLGGGAFVMSKGDLDSLASELAALETKKKELEGDRDKFLVEHARLSHIEQWKQGGADWLAHLNRLSEEMPNPKDATLDSISAGASIVVGYAPGTGGYPDGEWTATPNADIQLAGKTDRRETAIDLRGRLVSGELGTIYQVANKGADQPDRFSLELRTNSRTPARALTTPPAKTAPKAAAPVKSAGGGK